jgi:amino acid permease
MVYVSVHPLLVFMFYLIVYHDLDYNTQVETDKTLHNIILNTLGEFIVSLTCKYLNANVDNLQRGYITLNLLPHVFDLIFCNHTDT